jgi:hypothetical protein
MAQLGPRLPAERDARVTERRSWDPRKTGDLPKERKLTECDINPGQMFPTKLIGRVCAFLANCSSASPINPLRKNMKADRTITLAGHTCEPSATMRATCCSIHPLISPKSGRRIAGTYSLV